MSKLLDIELSEDQKNGLQIMVKFMNDPKARTLVLVGHAGTGKTTLLQHFIKLIGRRFSVAFTAPTHKAARVLREMSREAEIQVDKIATVYSLLGLRLTPDGEVKVINQSGISKVGDFDLVGVDEGSQVNSAVFSYIKQSMASTCTKFIMIGDSYQAPPIGEERSEVFDNCDYKVVLNEIVRQAKDNPIIQLTTSLRDSIDQGRRAFSLETSRNAAGKGVHLLNKATWETWMRSGFASDLYKSDGDSFRAVAWRNVTVDYFNRRIRQALYKGQSSEPYIVGERVLNAEPIQDEEGEEVLAPTDSEGIVREVNIGIHPYLKRNGFGEFKTTHLAIGYEEAGLVDAYVLHSDSQRDYNIKMTELSSQAKKDKALWHSFWEFKDSFHDLRPAHAITSHRSQGSTYTNCFVDVGDILKNRNWKESMQLLYVACSRAKENLILLE